MIPWHILGVDPFFNLFMALMGGWFSVGLFMILAIAILESAIDLKR